MPRLAAAARRLLRARLIYEARLEEERGLALDGPSEAWLRALAACNEAITECSRAERAWRADPTLPKGATRIRRTVTWWRQRLLRERVRRRRERGREATAA